MERSSLCIATWNLDRPWKNGKTRRATEQVERMLSIDADIWVLTETWCGIRLPGYTSVRSPWSLGVYDPSESAAAIHVRDNWVLHEIESTTLTISAEALRPGGATPLLIIGTIIPWHAAPGGGKWEVHEREAQKQVEAWIQLREHRPDHRFIVAGDFNTTLCAENVGYGTEVGRTHIRRGLDAARLFCLTASSRIPDEHGDPTRRPVIDHILVDGRLEPSTHVAVDMRPGTHGRPLSDHPCLSVQVHESS